MECVRRSNGTLALNVIIVNNAYCSSDDLRRVNVRPTDRPTDHTRRFYCVVDEFDLPPTIAHHAVASLNSEARAIESASLCFREVPRTYIGVNVGIFTEICKI